MKTQFEQHSTAVGQEWTPEYVAGLMARSPLKSRESELLRGYQVVADAHNAALAEREHLAEWKRAHKAVSKLADGAIRRRQQAEQQLLQAQAAIAEHNKAFDNNEEWKYITIDLSALDKHDAEVRKPLVNALERIHNGNTLEASTLQNIASDALAKGGEIKLTPTRV